MYRPPFLVIVFVAVTLATLGCSKTPTLRTVKVTGTVNYQGRPVEGAQVSFMAARGEGGRSATDVTDSAGRFRLKTYVGGTILEDGALPDDYTVVIFKTQGTGLAPTSVDAMSKEDRERMIANASPPVTKHGFSSEDAAKQAMEADRKSAAAERKSLLPDKYASVDTSDLKASVNTGEKNEFNFDLTD